MARIRARVKTDANLNPKTANEGGGGGGVPAKYQLLEPGMYPARINSMTSKTYKSKSSGLQYYKLIPLIYILNDKGTEISHQDFVVGTINEDGEIFRADGDEEKSPIWGGINGASYMLQALGMFFEDDETGEWVLDLDPDQLLDRIVNVTIKPGGYIKGKGNFSPDQIEKMLKEVNDGLDYDFEDINGLVDLWNTENGYLDEEGNLVTKGIALRLKNVVTGFWAMDPDEAEELGFVVDDEGRIFPDVDTMEYTLNREEMEVSDAPDWGEDDEEDF